MTSVQTLIFKMKAHSTQHSLMVKCLQINYLRGFWVKQTLWASLSQAIDIIDSMLMAIRVTQEGNLIDLYCDSLKTARKTSQQITVRFYTIKNVRLCVLEFEEEGMIKDFGPWNDTRIDISQMHDYRYVSEFRTVQGVPAKVLQYFYDALFLYALFVLLFFRFLITHSKFDRYSKAPLKRCSGHLLNYALDKTLHMKDMTFFLIIF